MSVKDTEKRSALHAAAFCGEAEIAELLLLNGARVNTKDSRWLTPLHRACCSKSVVSTLSIWHSAVLKIKCFNHVSLTTLWCID